MALYFDFASSDPCVDHGNATPAGAWWVGSELMTCAACDRKFAGWECACELVHDCAVA